MILDQEYYPTEYIGVGWASTWTTVALIVVVPGTPSLDSPFPIFRTLESRFEV